MKSSSLDKVLKKQLDSLKKLNENMLCEEELIIGNEIEGLQQVLFCREALIDEMQDRRAVMIRKMKADKEQLENSEIQSLFYQLEFLVDKLNQQSEKNQELLNVRASL